MLTQMVQLSSIHFVSNVRLQNGFDKDSLEAMSASIATHGLLQPLVIREAAPEDETEKQFVIIAGRRRLQALQMAKAEMAPCVILQADSEAAYQMEITENLQREQMTLADTARAVRTLMMIYDNAKKIGQILNKSPAWISKHLTLTASSFPTPIAELMDQGKVTDLETLLLMRQIAKQGNTTAGMAAYLRTLKLAADGNLSRQLARDILAKLTQPAPEPAAPVTVTTTHTKATHQETVVAAAAEHATTFSVSIPIAYLQAFEQAGGVEWLCKQLDAEGATS